MRSPRPLNYTRTRARKATSTATRSIHPAAGRLRRGGMAVGRPIGCRLPGGSDASAARSAYKCVTTGIAPPYSHLSRHTPGPRPPSIRTSGRHMIVSRRPGVPIRRFAIRGGAENGRGMMGMASAKCMTIRSKASGPGCGTSSARFAGSASGFSASMWPSLNGPTTSSGSQGRSYVP